MATNRQRSISCSDDDWHTVQDRAKSKGLSVSEYLLALSHADDGADADADANAVDKISGTNDDRSMRRAVWFLYADRLTELKADGQQDRIDQLIAEARKKFE